MRHTVQVREFVAAGGALERSAAWTQIISDIIGRPIRLSAPAELTSRGAAMIAFEQLGVSPPDLGTLDSGHVAQPDAGRGRVYAAARKRQASLMKNVRSLKAEV